MSGLRDEDIGNFGTFTNTLHQPDIAKDYLKHNNFDLEKALDEWYTRGQDPNLYHNKEPVWTSGQYGPANQMQAMPPNTWDWAPPEEFHALASDPMSRPPSRNTQAAREHVAWAGQNQIMGTSANDDVQMREAMERSRRDLETVSSVGPSKSPLPSILARGGWNGKYPAPTESDLESDRGQKVAFHPFGRIVSLQNRRGHHSVVLPPIAPKKVSFYIPGESLTAPAPKVLDPEAKERSRQVGAPAFLKPLPDGDFLPSFINILHSIPSCRKQLLSEDELLSEYKSSDRWWEGDSIEIARITTPDGPQEAQPQKEIVYETQRLMAFLDRTSRAYGSAESLSKIMPVQTHNHAEDAYVRFIREWDAIALSKASPASREDGSWQSMFSSTLVSAFNIQNLTMRDELARRILLTSEHVPDETGVSLYDVLDRAILGDPSVEREWMHERFAPLIAIHLSSGPQPRRMQVPAALFVDRYLEQNAEFVRSSRTLIQEEISRAEEIGDKIAKIETFRHPQPFKQGDATKLMSTVMNYLTQRSGNIALPTVNGDAMVSETHVDEHAAKAKLVLDQLESITRILKDRLNNLNEEKKACEEKIKSYSRCGTDPQDPQFPASMRYQLRGFATTGYQRPSVTYAIYPMKKFGKNGLLGSTVEPQWWKLSYDTRYMARVRTEKVSEVQVLEAASEINYNALLVYVRDEFLQAGSQDQHLPTQLKDFVDRDNEAFSIELDEWAVVPQVLEGVPVEGNPAWDTPDTDSSFGGPAPLLSGDQDATTDPTMMEGNEGLPERVQEMEEIRRADPASPKKRKKSEEVDSDMETMAPDSDVEMGH